MRYGIPLSKALIFMPLVIRTLSDQIYDLVRQQIVMHEIKPGEAIRQDALAADFGTSKIPVREALARLEGCGMVQSLPNRGFVARPLSLEEVDDIFALRVMIEPQTAAETARIATEQQRALVLEAHAELAHASDYKGSMNGRRKMMLSLLIRPERPTATSIMIQLFDRSERYHPESVSIDFLDIGGLDKLVSAWLAGNATEVRALFTARLERRAELARASIAA